MENLIAYGGAVKAIESEGGVTVSGYLVRFGSEKDTDLTSDFFTKATNFGPSGEDGARVGVFYHHGLDPKIKGRQIGVGTLTVKDAGLWLESQIKASDEYVERVLRLAESGRLAYSSGAVAHLASKRQLSVKGRSVNHIDQWLIGEASLTPQAAEPRNVVTIKSLTEPGELSEIEAELDSLAEMTSLLVMGSNLDTLSRTLSGLTA